jgi:uncharacterized protein with HEPN domain
MSKRVLEFFIVDILISIDKIKRYTSEFSDGEDFYYDEKSFDATMRELQIIGEATKHLINGELLSSNYRMIVNFRNLVVHEYFGIDSDEVWSIISQHLPKFETEVLELFRKVEDRELLQRVIQHSKDDFINRKETIKFLEKLEQKL